MKTGWKWKQRHATPRKNGWVNSTSNRLSRVEECSYARFPPSPGSGFCEGRDECGLIFQKRLVIEPRNFVAIEIQINGP